MNLEAQIQSAVKEAGLAPSAKLVVAASGGCDSTVLLHVLHDLGHPLVVAHVDHGMRGEESSGDRKFVTSWAQTHGCALEVLELDPSQLAEGKMGFQGEARKARMAWFEEVCDAHHASAILTGHHADDQAETFMLHAMRSTDPWSIRGMALVEGRVVRPMLDLRRSDIEAFAKIHQWHWREDSSNQSEVYLRNRVRHELLPLMEKIRPGTTDHLQRLAKRAVELTELLEPLLSEARHKAQTQPGHWRVDVLQRNSLAAESLRRWLCDQGWSDKSSARALSLLEAQVGSAIQHGAWQLVRERSELVLSEAQTPLPAPVSVTDANSSGEWTVDFGTCRWEPTLCPPSTDGLHPGRFWIPQQWLPVTLRPWVHGDRIQPLGMSGHTKVSDVLTQAKLPHRLRPCALVVERESDTCILSVVGHKTSERARLDLAKFAGESGLMMSFTPTP